MIGLALQGGGARGAYQAGACIALKNNGIEFGGVCGTSIGAFNGAMIACHKEEELLNFWQNVKMDEILGFDAKYIKKKLAHEYDLDFIKLGFKNYLNIIKSRGIDIGGLEKVLKEYLDVNELLGNSIDFGICTVKLNNLTPMYIYKEEMNKDKLFDYILASCYLPIFKLEKKVDDSYYIDGGFYDSTPLNMLINKGYKKIYVVELNPTININQKPSKNVDIIRIKPSRSLGGVLNFDLESVRNNIKMGYYDTLRVIKNLDGFLYCFQKKSDIFYKFISRNIPRSEVRKVLGFFHVKCEKDAIIKAVEYVLKLETADYYKIYNILYEIKRINKSNHKDHIIYNFIRKIKFI